MADLRELQRVFHAAVTGSASIESARDVVANASHALRVYAHAYRVRLRDALATDFPKLRSLLGAAVFEDLVDGYLRVYPPHAPSMRDVGGRLARYLDETWSERTYADLAALEWVRIDVFDAADSMPLERADLHAVPADAFPDLKLSLVRAATIVELATNADDIWDAIENEQPPPAPRPMQRTVLAWRRDLTVVHRTLEADEAAALRLVASGRSFGDVCDVIARGDAPIERALELLVRWIDAAVLARV